MFFIMVVFFIMVMFFMICLSRDRRLCERVRIKFLLEFIVWTGNGFVRGERVEGREREEEGGSEG